jgi:general stress protein 26
MADFDELAFTGSMTTPQLSIELITRTIAKRSFCTLATTSVNGQPHVAGVMYAYVDGHLYVNTPIASRKGRNIAANPKVFVCIPVRRMPFGAPPSTVQFASTATILESGHTEIQRLAKDGSLKTIASHGELVLPGSCFLRIERPSTFLTYGLGLSLRNLAKDPLNAGGRLVLT